jgi:type 1 fimbriae regulatory protein FimB
MRLDPRAAVAVNIGSIHEPIAPEKHLVFFAATKDFRNQNCRKTLGNLSRDNVKGEHMSELQALTQPEIHSILKLAASESTRNHAMILLAFKHGMRASEVCSLRLNDIDLKNGTIIIKRVKGSLKSTQSLIDIPGQPLLSEKRVLRSWLEERQQYRDPSDYLFLSQKGGKLDRSSFYRLFQSTAERAGLPKVKQHPHCLKHSLGFFLIEQGIMLPSIQQALGHRSLSSTGAYLKVTDERANRDVAKAFANGF